MTNGEYGKPQQPAPEVVQGEQPPQVELLLQHPMELDLSSRDEGVAAVAKMREGIYEYTEAGDRYLPANVSDDARRRFHNVLQTSDDVVPLKGHKFYVNKPTNTSGPTNLERAEAMVDRIAEMLEDESQLFLDDAIQRIRREGKILPFYVNTFMLAEDVCRQHPRLQTTRERLGAGVTGPEQIITVHEVTPGLPATVGEAITRVLHEMWPDKVYTNNQYFKRVCDRLNYTAATCSAIYEAIRLDPRIEAARRYATELRLQKARKIKEADLSDLTGEIDIQRTSFQELARCALDNCGTFDLQSRNEILAALAPGQRIPRGVKRAIIETLLYDPRVMLSKDPEYLQILHSPEDKQRYVRVVEVVRAALGVLAEKGARSVWTKELDRLMRAAARQRNVELTEHVTQLLQTLLRIEPGIVHPIQGKRFKLRRPARPRAPEASKPALPLVTPEEELPEASPDTSPDTEPVKLEITPPEPDIATPLLEEVSTPPPEQPEQPESEQEELTEEQKEELAYQALVQEIATKMETLEGQLDHERAAALRAITDEIITRHVDDAATSMLVDRLVGLAESHLRQQNDHLLDEEREYLGLVFSRADKFEPIVGRDGVLRVRAPSATTGIIAGKSVRDLAQLRKTY